MNDLLNKLLLPGLAMILLSGCGGGPARSSLLQTPLGPDLEALWDAHGGLSSWSRFAGASLDYEGTGAGPLASAGSISSRVIIEFGSPGAITWLAKEDAVAGGAGGRLATSSLSSLFHLPFELNQPGWKLRRAMVLQATDKPFVEFEASQPGGARKMGPFFFRFNKLRGGLPSVHYIFRGASPGNGVYRVEFQDYTLIQGILVATSRKHYSLTGSRNRITPPQGKPFSPASQGEASALWIEKFRNLRFLTREELQASNRRKTEEP